jgi:addiction module RelE/StbE family toxin
MDLRWTRGAADDLQRIADHLIERAPTRAGDLVRTLYDAPRSLLTFPSRGRSGKRAGTRELVLSPLPYVIVYQVRGDQVIVVRILHGAQRWPPREND